MMNYLVLNGQSEVAIFERSRVLTPTPWCFPVARVKRSHGKTGSLFETDLDFHHFLLNSFSTLAVVFDLNGN